jgi:hypothetical protein
MAVFGSNVTLSPLDKVQIEEKVTSAYFSDGAVELLATDIVTTSLADANESYYVGISNDATPTVGEFDVAFGSLNGYGSKLETGTIAETKAIYKQFASLLLSPNEVTGGFFISRNKATSAVPTAANVASGPDEEIYILVGKRSNYKDRLNKKNWTIILSGSNNTGSGSIALSLTDDSADDNPTPTVAGDRYNIVSGSDGTISGSGAATKTYGHYYPDVGILLFSGAELSASIPGVGLGVYGSNTGSQEVVFDSGSQKGFRWPIDVSSTNDTKQAIRFVNCLQPTDAKLKFRDEEDQISSQYFCRLPAGGMNFSNNPTFVSGSNNELRQKTMWDAPNTFITSVQLYNNTGDMVAVANLSTPIKKNFSSEATIKVKLTF